MRSWSAGNNGQPRDSCVGGAGMGVFVGLFPDADSDSENEQDRRVYHHDAKATPAAQKSGAAVWSLFPDKDGETLPQPAGASVTGGGRSRRDGATPGVANRMWRSFNPAKEKVAGEPSASSQAGRTTKQIRKVEFREENQNKTVPSLVQAGVDDKEADDVEAARCRTRSPSTSRSWSPGAPPDREASSGFELNEDRDPADWMKVGDTTGITFLWFTVMLQIATACCSIIFLASNGENQLSWKTGCWGMWTSLSDAENVEFVEFDTHIGWQLYGKGDKLGLLSEVSDRAAVVGGLAGGMHTLVVFTACGFAFFSLSALILTYASFFCPWQGSSSSKEGSMEAGEGGRIESALPRSPLVLAKDCHRWLFAMAAMDIFAGLWCFGVGCAGFYVVVVRDLTQGLENVITGWGESVSCAKPQTSPRYGFFVNGLSVLLLLGGGIISLLKTYASHRDLKEAMEMWKNDRAEVAEMQSRLAMIRKKEEYAAAVASAAEAAAESPAIIFKSRKAVTSAMTVPEPAAPVAVPAVDPAGESRSGRSSRSSSPLDRVLSLSPPSPREVSAMAGSPATERREQHVRKPSTLDFDHVHLEHGEDTGTGGNALSQLPSILESPCLPSAEVEGSSVHRDVECGSGAGEGAAAAVDDLTDDKDRQAAIQSDDSDDLSAPHGWEVRTTPSGDKFWVNILSKNVSWDRPV